MIITTFSLTGIEQTSTCEYNVFIHGVESWVLTALSTPDPDSSEPPATDIRSALL